MNKKWDELGKSKLVALVEENAGRNLTERERKQIVQGAEEHDLVYSGLEDTMIMACEETRQTAAEKVGYRRVGKFMVWGVGIVRLEALTNVFFFLSRSLGL